MTLPTYKRLTIVFAVLSFVFFALDGYHYRNYASQDRYIRLAWEQTWGFEQNRVTALSGDPKKATDCLWTLSIYFPYRGRQQEKGSVLDAIVERDRTNAIREIINHLRAKTGEDLGDNPEAWIKKYGNK